MSDPLRIATRKSPLALWQAEHVAARLAQAHPGLRVELVGMSTQGECSRRSHRRQRFVGFFTSPELSVPSPMTGV